MRNLFFGVLILWAADGYTQDYKLNYDVYFPFARACSDPPGPPKFQFRLSFNTFNNATVRTIASGDGFVMSIKGVLSIPANEGPIKTIWLYSHRFFPLDASFPRLISNELQRVVYQNPDTLLDVHNTFNLRDIIPFLII